MKEEDRYLTKELINKIDGISQEGMQPLNRRLMDLAVWFHKHRGDIPEEDIQKRLEFHEKMLDTMLEMIALWINQDINSKKSESLWLPNGIVDTHTGKRYG